MKLQKLLGKFRRAVYDYNLIKDGDKIAVGLSGGKDSLVLLHLLAAYREFSPEKFELMAITLDPGAEADFSPMVEICQKLNVEYKIIPTNISKVVFDIRNEKNPCSLCAKLRRGMLNTAAKENNCNKIALGHHKNDAIETLLMALFYEGRISCFTPDTYLSRVDINIIRPMIYLDEEEIINFVKQNNLPIVENPCPANGKTKREFMKTLTYELEEKIPGLKKNLLGALSNTDQLTVWQKEKGK